MSKCCVSRVQKKKKKNPLTLSTSAFKILWGPTRTPPELHTMVLSPEDEDDVLLLPLAEPGVWVVEAEDEPLLAWGDPAPLGALVVVTATLQRAAQLPFHFFLPWASIWASYWPCVAAVTLGLPPAGNGFPQSSLCMGPETIVFVTTVSLHHHHSGGYF